MKLEKLRAKVPEELQPEAGNWGGNGGSYFAACQDEAKVHLSCDLLAFWFAQLGPCLRGQKVNPLGPLGK